MKRHPKEVTVKKAGGDLFADSMELKQISIQIFFLFSYFNHINLLFFLLFDPIGFSFSYTIFFCYWKIFRDFIE